MKTNKFLILSCAAATLCFPCLADAQTSPPGPQAGGPLPLPGGGELLLRTLQLTDAQKAQLQSYMNAVLPQITAARQQERQTEIALMTQLSAQIRSFLTTDQQARRAAESRRKDVFKMVSDTSLM